MAQQAKVTFDSANSGGDKLEIVRSFERAIITVSHFDIPEGSIIVDWERLAEVIREMDD